MTLLVNPSFEGGWADVVMGRVVQVPTGWRVTVKPIGVSLDSAGAFAGIDHTPVIETAKTIAEIIHKPAALLPPVQGPGGADALILDGNTTFKIFSNYNPYGVRLAQTVTATPGATVALTVPVRVHYNPYPGGDDSPGACAFRAYVNGVASAWLTYGNGLYDREWVSVTLQCIVPASGTFDVGAIFESRSEAGIDFFTDAWRLEYVSVPEPEPEPECAGLPRIDYVRTVNVIRQDATAARAAAIFAMCWANGKQTVTGSYDDAGIGDLSEKTAVLWDIDAVFQPEYQEFYQEYYPGTRVVFQGDSGPVVPPVVPPVDGNEPAPLPAPASLIGLHMQNPKTGWVDYYRMVKPGVYKALQLGMCLEVRDASPGTLVVYRHHVNNDGAWLHKSDGSFLSSTGLRASAYGFLDLYSADFAAHALNAGMTVAQILARIDVIESINEVIGTHDTERDPAVEFDCYFAQAIEARYGNALKAGLLTIPVGNPHESEVISLLPAAKVAADGGHYLTYHGYWGANSTRSFLASTWPQIAGRFTEWDTVFRAHGVYPRYYLGESGICHSEDGWNLNNVLGWKGCGPFSKYITDLQNFDRIGRQWNALHGNRLRGMTIFCYGSSGWVGYDFEPGDLAELAKALA